jgi:hypothetical protein
MKKKIACWLGSCCEKTWAGRGQQASLLLVTACSRSIRSPLLRQKMLAFATTTTVHVNGSPPGAASAHVCNSLITFKTSFQNRTFQRIFEFRPQKFASFQEVLPFAYFIT